MEFRIYRASWNDFMFESSFLPVKHWKREEKDLMNKHESFHIFF